MSTNNDMNEMVRKMKGGISYGNYGPDADRLVKHSMEKYIDHVKGKRGLVIGSETAWIEITALELGAKHITTLEFSKIYSENENITTKEPRDFAIDFMMGNTEPFDFIISFSSLEHPGLGRYGDSLDPYGDIMSVAQAYCVLKDGGVFFLGLPVLDSSLNRCGVQWNAHRYYGKERLQYMAANYDHLETFQGPQPIFVLQKNLN